ncbi:hypothetical protein NP233_g5132 [Leucocoprinus birnbaumii]|uniref:F-box domain-containing protein n=1 Tax=Leucocoprinus birnbaumii TaxID=56174 RepID=A0AAD5VVS1_9AGAR|nr:hypothetical protein NP233_g5132 [Leucocoprinus birnbaumii]
MNFPDAQASHGTDPTVNVLPEVLSTIFEIVLNYSDEIKQKLNLGAVCSRWRQIISSPVFWTTFSVRFESYKQEPDHLELLKLHIANSKDCAMTFKILGLDDCDTRIHDEVFQRIFSNGHAGIRGLELQDMETSVWEYIVHRSRSSNFSQLEHLSLPSFDDPMNHLLLWFSKMPLLRKLALNAPRFDPHIIPSLNKITSLTIKCVPSDHALYFLSLCPSLGEFQVSGYSPRPYLKEFVPPSPLTKDIVFPHLTHFTWRQGTTASQYLTAKTAFIRHMHFPALRHLYWDCDFALPGTWNIWSAFFMDLSALTHVVLSTETPDVSSKMVELFSSRPVEELSVMLCSLEDFKTCVRILTCLPDNKSPPYPSLHTLKFRLSLSFWEPHSHELPGILDPIIEMLQSRNSPAVPSECAMIQCFNFRFMNMFETFFRTWAATKRLVALKALHDGGLEFEGWEPPEMADTY